jgi:hypothetical protein
LVQGERVVAPVPVRDGDRILSGSVAFVSCSPHARLDADTEARLSPSAQSVRASKGSARTCSGDIYATVPRISASSVAREAVPTQRGEL